MSPFLSIIVPVYKVEKYLRQCVESILVQTFSDFELILVDDGSPDHCPAICDEYAKMDNRVKVIHQANGGLVRARKTGAVMATGRYIGFVDSDDWIERSMYSSLCNAAIQYNTDIVICDIIHSYPNKEEPYAQYIKPGFYNNSDLTTKIYPVMIFSGEFYKFGLHPAVWNKIFKRELLIENLKNVDDSIRMGEDAACTYPCLLGARSIYLLDNSFLYHYRQGTSSMTKTYDNHFLERILKLYKTLKYKSNENTSIDLSVQLYYYLAYLVIGAVRNELSTCNIKNNHEKFKFIKNLCFDKEITEAINKISLKGMNLQYKILLLMIRKKNYLLLYLLFNIRFLQK